MAASFSIHAFEIFKKLLNHNMNELALLLINCCNNFTNLTRMLHLLPGEQQYRDLEKALTAKLTNTYFDYFDLEDASLPFKKIPFLTSLLRPSTPKKLERMCIQKLRAQENPDDISSSGVYYRNFSTSFYQWFTRPLKAIRIGLNELSIPQRKVVETALTTLVLGAFSLSLKVGKKLFSRI